jgi:hypothetical protein
MMERSNNNPLNSLAMVILFEIIYKTYSRVCTSAHAEQCESSACLIKRPSCMSGMWSLFFINHLYLSGIGQDL